ncbi:MAG: GAF domain-containing protein [Candidatus Bathyarchaeota archaeon]
MKVIHIDDESSHLHFTKMFLEMAHPGLKVHSASSVEELNNLLAMGADCIVSDYKMPRVNGIELCESIKKKVDVPFILYTGHGSEFVAEKAFAVGVDDYIRKEMDPSHYRVLSKRITQAVEKYRSQKSNNLYKKRLETLHRYAINISSAIEVDEIAYLSFEAIKETLECSFAGFHLLRGNELVELYITGATVNEPYVQPLDGPGVTVRAVKSGLTQIVHDTRQDEDYVSWPKDLVLLSEVAVPFTLGEQVAGVLNVESERQDAFTKEDVTLLEILSSYISSSLTRLQQVETYRESERRWKSFLESSMDAAFVMVGTEIVYANKRAVELLGYHDRSEFIGLNSLLLVKYEDREMVRSRMLSRQRGEDQPNQYDLTLIDRQGKEIVVETNASLIEYYGEPASLSYCRDISARKRYEKKLTALHKSAIRLGKSYSLDDVCDVILDTIESVLGFQFAGIAMHEDGYLKYVKTRGVVFAKEWVIPVTAKCVTARAFRSRKTQIIRDTRLDPDYTNPPVDTASDYTSLSELTLPINENGNILGVINIESKDLDAFTTYDAELVEILAMHSASAIRRILEKNELQKIIDQKTRESIESEKHKAIAMISSMVAHDMRGPLQTIKNCVYFLQKDDEGYSAKISSAVDYAVKMLEDLQQYTDRTPLNQAPISLNALVLQTIQDIIMPIAVDVEVTLEDLDGLMLDYTKMRRVLNNLVANSLEAMPQGGSLRINGYLDEDMVRIEVSDTGVGISEDVMNKLLTDFITTKPNGHGLGLPFCKRVIEAHGGRIQIQSKVNEGTVVTMTIPYVHESVENPEPHIYSAQYTVKEAQS